VFEEQNTGKHHNVKVIRTTISLTLVTSQQNYNTITML